MKKYLMAFLGVLIVLSIIFVTANLNVYTTFTDEKDEDNVLEEVLDKEGLRFEYNRDKVAHVSRDSSLDFYTNMEVYNNEDGTKTAYFFDEPIRYAKEEDDVIIYKPINNDIIPVNREIYKEELYDSFAYKNAENGFDIFFPDKLSKDGNGILIDNSDFEMHIKPLNFNSENARFDENRKNYICYDNAFGQNTGLEYILSGDGFKDNIVLLSNNAENVFKYEISTSIPLDFIVQENGSYSIFSDDNEELTSISPIFVYDSSDEFNFTMNNYMKFHRINEYNWVMEIVVDQEFLKDKNTVYPVYVDPKVILDGSNSNVGANKKNGLVYDAPVYQNYPNSNYGNYTYAYMGYNSTYGVGRVYMKFDTPWVELNISNITSAYYKVTEVAGGSGSMQFNMYLVDLNKASKWDEKIITWANVPPSQELLNTSPITLSNNTVNYIDITKAVKRWIPEWRIDNIFTPENNGIMFKSTNETSSSLWKGFATKDNSSLRPMIEINFTSDINVQNYGVYFIKNVNSGKYLQIADYSKQQPYSDQSESLRVKFVKSSIIGSEYYIQCMTTGYTNCFLYMDGIYLRRSTANPTTNNNYIFKVVGLGNGRVKIETKASSLAKVLCTLNASTASGEYIIHDTYTISTPNDEWVLEPCIKINTYYDKAFNQKWGINAKNDLQSIINRAIDKYYNATGIRMISNVVSFTTAITDPSVCNVGIDNICNHANNDACIRNYNINQGFNSYHHKNWRKFLAWSKAQAKNDPNNSKYSVRIMVTGDSAMCQYDASEAEHFLTGLGLSYLGDRASIYKMKESGDYLSGIVHELMHLFGGNHHNYDGVSQCVMGKNVGDPQLVQERMFCDSCIQFVKLNAPRLSVNDWSNY